MKREQRQPRRLYNISMASPAPNPPSGKHRHPIYAAEATGLLLMAIVLLIVIVIRYWHSIAWSAR